MKVLLKEVKGGTVGSKLRYIDYWILGRLENGDEIEIFDFEPFNLKKFENHKVYCLIYAWIQEITSETDKQYNFIGEFIEDYEIPSIWLRRDPKLEAVKNEYNAIRTAAGIFLTDSDEFDNDIKDGQAVIFNVVRFDLICWLK
ncbi:MAG: hypothetical protein ACFFAO_07565 [Candidatus Hermodarchaeota archaeon]